MRQVNFASQCGLGDCLLHAHWMRAAMKANPGVRFGFFVREEILGEIWDALHGVDRVLAPLQHAPSDSIVVPLHAADMPHGMDLTDFVGCKVWQYQRISEVAGLRPALLGRNEWLMDCPEILRPSILTHDFDVLVINAEPRSGQWMGYYPADLGSLVADLRKKCRVVTTHKAPGVDCLVTDHYALSVAQIGNLSLHCRAVVAVATGPIWPTFNIFNRDRNLLRVVLIDRERLDFGLPVEHCATVERAKEVLASNGFI